MHKGVKVSLARKKDWIALTEGDLESHERGRARGARAVSVNALATFVRTSVDEDHEMLLAEALYSRLFC